MVKLLGIGQVVLFLGMVAVSVWGWKHIAPQTRVRARASATGIDWTMSKRTTLVLTPFIGALILTATLTSGESSARETLAGLGFAVMAVFLTAHYLSIRRAAR